MSAKHEFLLAKVLAILLISLQFSLYGLIWLRLLSNPSLKGMDFISFYTAGRIARNGNYSHLYDLEAQHEIQHKIVDESTFQGGVNLSQHPPYLAPLLSLLAIDNYVHAYVYWTIVRLLIVVACEELIRRFLLRLGWNMSFALLTALGTMGFWPFFLGLLEGQDTVFVMLGLFLFLFGLLEGREISAGAGLALASLSPLIVGALGLPLLVTYRKAAFYFVSSMILLVLYSLTLVGFQGLESFMDLMRLSSQGTGYGLNQLYMYNLLGLLLRNFPGLGLRTSQQVSWGAFILIVISLTALWWNRRYDLRKEHIGTAVVLSVFTLPHLHIHGLSYLLLPLLVLVIFLYDQDHKGMALLLVPLISTLLVIVIFVLPTLKFVLYYFLMIILFGGLYISPAFLVMKLRKSVRIV